MSTLDVPGANPANKDKLAMGSWAEHDDGSLVFVEAVEGGRAVYTIFDIAQDPPVEYRDAMPESGFKNQFSWQPTGKSKEKWTWHDKTPFPWDRIMRDFPAGAKVATAADQLSAAGRVAQSLNLRAQGIRDREEMNPTEQKAATTIGQAILDALRSLKK